MHGIFLHFLIINRSWVDPDFKSILGSFAVILFIGVSRIIFNALVALFRRVGLRRGFIAASLHNLVEQGRCPGIATVLLLG